MSRGTLKALVLALSVCAGCAASARPQAGRERSFGAAELEPLLQRFVDEQYLKAFAVLGDEADFDHCHLLFGPGSPRRPVAVLYHTRELSSLRHKDRSWLQWADSGRIEDASRCERGRYPPGASWDWFREVELPVLRRHHTVLDKMLDPALFGGELGPSRQLVFTRVDCGAAPAGGMEIRLPGGAPVCLALADDGV